MKKTKEVQTISKTNKKRLFIFVVLLYLFLFYLIGRLVYLQFFQGNYLKGLANTQQTTVQSIEASRGSILDCNRKNSGCKYAN